MDLSKCLIDIILFVNLCTLHLFVHIVQGQEIFFHVLYQTPKMVLREIKMERKSVSPEAYRQVWKTKVVPGNYNKIRIIGNNRIRTRCLTETLNPLFYHIQVETSSGSGQLWSYFLYPVRIPDQVGFESKFSHLLLTEENVMRKILTNTALSMCFL